MAFTNRRAVTFIEIVIAVGILAVAMIPLFGLMSRQTVDTDRNASQAFAMNKASEILNAILDNVPFAALRQGNPGFIKVDDIATRAKYQRYNEDWARKMVPVLFPGSDNQSAGWPCRGVFTDSRGISYLVHLRVEDVTSEQKPPRPERVKIGPSFPAGSPTSFAETREMTFAFLRNPAILSDGSWLQEYSRDPAQRPYAEVDLGSGRGVAESPNDIYRDEGMEGASADEPRYLDPTAERYTTKMVTEKVPYDVSDKYGWCVMKKLLVQVQWNLDQRYFNNPEATEGRVQRIHLMTIKGDID
ncbi:MAG TPA: hypothetical protein DCG57_11585 [Candidatus Riflebacteria bacterium]|jgi:hypothetical protein|nr:MAG: hypothetical protein CVV41_08080 [Candidatus Riflebacteria bacterium HGW-Riflebacteria-1]HAE39263.1 hypothetical protein [Candidatus Riflebacteria bacterium]